MNRNADTAQDYCQIAPALQIPTELKQGFLVPFYNSYYHHIATYSNIQRSGCGRELSPSHGSSGRATFLRPTRGQQHHFLVPTPCWHYNVLKTIHCQFVGLGRTRHLSCCRTIERYSPKRAGSSPCRSWISAHTNDTDASQFMIQSTTLCLRSS